MDQHHQDCSQVNFAYEYFDNQLIIIQLPANIPGYIFTQQQQPQHWNEAIYGPANWPMNVLLLPGIPSANHSQKKYKVLILYKGSNIPWVPLGPNHWLGFPGSAGHIHAICCGPSRDTACPVGARMSPCAHGAAALLAGCVLPTNPVNMFTNNLSCCNDKI